MKKDDSEASVEQKSGAAVTGVSSEQLYQMCLRGENVAWELVYKYVRCIAYDRRWRLGDNAEELVSDIVGKLALSALDKVKDGKAFQGFISEVSKNYIKDYFKKRRPVLVAGLGEESDSFFEIVAPQFETPEDKLRYTQLRERLDSSVKALPDRCHDVLTEYVEYKMGGYLSVQELADRFQTVVGTFSSWVNRCLKQLRCRPEIAAWLEDRA